MKDNILRVRITGDNRDFSIAIDQSGKRLGGFAEKGKRANKAVKESADLTTGSFKLMAGAIGLVATAIGGYSIGTMVTETIAATRETEAWARAMGESTQNLMAMDAVGQRAALGQGKMADILKDTTEKIGEAYKIGTGEAVEALEVLGIQIDSIAAKSPVEQLLQIGGALDNLETVGQRVQVLEALASDAALLRPYLEDNAKLMRELMQEAIDSGKAISDIDAAKLSIVGVQMGKISANADGLSKQLTVALAPAIYGATLEIQDMISEWGGMGNVAGKAIAISVEGISKFLNAGNDLHIWFKKSEIGWLAMAEIAIGSFADIGDSGISLINTVLDPIRNMLGNIAAAKAAMSIVVAELTNDDELKQRALNMAQYAVELKTTSIAASDLRKRQDELNRSLSEKYEELKELKNALPPGDWVKKWLSGNEEALNALSVSADKANKSLSNTSEVIASVTGSTQLKDSAVAIADIYDDTASSIQGSFRGAFRDLLDGQNTLADRMKSVFKDMLADMAMMAIARPIMIPINQYMSSIGLSQAAVGVGAGAVSGAATGAAVGVGAGAATGAATGAAVGVGAGAASGSMMGAVATAMPWVLGAVAAGLIIDEVSGGKLFGTDWETSNSGVNLDYDGALTGQQFTTETRERRLFGGKSTRTNYSDLDNEVLDALGASMALGRSMLGGASAFGVNNIDGALDGFSLSGSVDLKGKSEGEIKKALQSWVDNAVVAMAVEVFTGTDYEALIKQASRVTIDALMGIGGYLTADIGADAQEALRVAGLSLKGVYDEQTDSILALAAAFDGGKMSTLALLEATQQRYQSEISMLHEITGIRDSIGNTVADSILSIQESIMSPDELYSSISGRADATFNELMSATNVNDVNALSDELVGLTDRMYGLIPDQEKESYANEFVDYLSQIESVSSDRLTSVEEDVKRIHEATAVIIQDAITEAANELTVAAEAQAAAAAVAEAEYQERLAAWRELYSNTSPKDRPWMRAPQRDYE